MATYGCREFESDVISDSGKTTYSGKFAMFWFESDVISDSGKTFDEDEFCAM